jgi:hypothetical protein
MPRVRSSEARAIERREAAASFVRAVVPKRLKKAKRRPSLPPRSRLMCDVVLMLKSGDWPSATPAHLVELYDWCHEKVYGVASPELNMPDERLGACSAARSLLTKEFGGDSTAAVAFLRWAWAREEGREKWARQNQKERGRLAWRTLFSGRGVLGDYRVAAARAAKNAG